MKIRPKMKGSWIRPVTSITQNRKEHIRIGGFSLVRLVFRGLPIGCFCQPRIFHLANLGHTGIGFMHDE